MWLRAETCPVEACQGFLPPRSVWICRDTLCFSSGVPVVPGMVFFQDGRCWTVTNDQARVPDGDTLPRGQRVECVSGCSDARCPSGSYLVGRPCSPGYVGPFPYVCGIDRCVTICISGMGRFVFDPSASMPVPGHQLPPGAPTFPIDDPRLVGAPDCCTPFPCPGQQPGCVQAPLISGDQGDPSDADCFPPSYFTATCCCDLDVDGIVKGRVRVQRHENIQTGTLFDNNQQPIPAFSGTTRNYLGTQYLDGNGCATYDMLQDRTGYGTDPQVGLVLPFRFNFGCRACAQWPLQAPRRVDGFGGSQGTNWGVACHGYESPNSPVGSERLVVNAFVPSYTCTRMSVLADYTYLLYREANYQGGIFQRTDTRFEFTATIEGGSDSCGSCGGRIQGGIPVPGGDPGNLPGAPPIGAPCQGCGSGQARRFV